MQQSSQQSCTNNSYVNLDAFHIVTCRCTGITGFCQHAKPNLAIINTILEMVKVAAGKQYYGKQFLGRHKS